MKAKFKFVFNRKKKEEENRIEKSVDLEIYFANKTRCYMRTKIYAEEKFWDAKRGQINQKHPMADEYNAYLTAFRQTFEQKELDCITRGVPFDKAAVAEAREKKSNDSDFIQFCHDTNRSEYERKVITYASWKRYGTVIRAMSGILPSGELRFCDVESPDFFEKIERFAYQKYKGGYCAKFIRAVKKYAIAAKKKGLLEKDPFDGFKIRKAKTQERPNLTESEVRSLEQIDRTQLRTNEDETLDRFLFSCYTGLRISDNKRLSARHVTDGENGLMLDLVTEKMQGSRIVLPLDVLFDGRPAQILRKYLARRAGEKTIFPELSDQKTNAHLKHIAAVAGIDKRLTFHVSRHTCASLLAEKTGNPFVIMQILGHSDIKTSMIYIHNSQKAVIDSLKGAKW